MIGTTLLANNGFSDFGTKGYSPETSYTDFPLGCSSAIYGLNRANEQVGVYQFPFIEVPNWSDVVSGKVPLPKTPLITTCFADIDPTKPVEVFLELWLNIGDNLTSANFYYSEINAGQTIIYPKPISHSAVAEHQTIELVFPTQGLKIQSQFYINFYPAIGPNLNNFELSKIGFRYLN